MDRAGKSQILVVRPYSNQQHPLTNRPRLRKLTWLLSIYPAAWPDTPSSQNNGFISAPESDGESDKGTLALVTRLLKTPQYDIRGAQKAKGLASPNLDVFKDLPCSALANPPKIQKSCLCQTRPALLFLAQFQQGPPRHSLRNKQGGVEENVRLLANCKTALQERVCLMANSDAGFFAAGAAWKALGLDLV